MNANFIDKLSLIFECGKLEGKAHGMSLEDIFKKHQKKGWKGSLEDLKKQLEMGITVEKEHTDDLEIAKKIALDHLEEIVDYYFRLKKMEKSAND
jgi:hypothetical protein